MIRFLPLCFALVLAAPWSASAMVVLVPSTLTIEGHLTDSDALATDATGTFHFDAYSFMVDVDTSVAVTLSSPAFAPWLAYWNQAVFPGSTWNGSDDLYLTAGDIAANGMPGSVGFAIEALAGTVYHVAVGTFHYNPTGLGAYTLAFDAGGVGITVAPVPLPAAAWLFSAALATLAVSRRRVRGRATCPA